MRPRPSSEPELDTEAFMKWLGTQSFAVNVTKEHGQWYAEATEFGIVGMAQSQKGARENVAKLVITYLIDACQSGATFEQARRFPAPSEPKAEKKRRRSLIGHLRSGRFHDRQIPYDTCLN
jgi:hypothetical protein